MREMVTFGNIEADVVEFLEPLALASAFECQVIRVLKPPLPDGPFVRVLLTGSRRLNISQMERQVTLEAWGGSDAQAHDLGSLVYGWVGSLALADGTHVPDGEDGWLGGPYPEPDPRTERPRYVMTAIVVQPARHL